MSEATVLFRKFEIEIGGKKWSLPRPTLGVERIYATYLEKQTAAAINRNRMALGIGYSEALRQFTTSCVANHFGWRMPAFAASLDSTENLAQFVMAWVNINHPAEGDPLHIASEKAAYELVAKNREKWDAVMTEVFSDDNPLLPE
jgi:hypothetical protein